MINHRGIYEWVSGWDSDTTYLVLPRRLARSQRSVADSVRSWPCSRLPGSLILDPAPSSSGLVIWPSLGTGGLVVVDSCRLAPLMFSLGRLASALTQVFKHGRHSLLLQRDTALKHPCPGCQEPGPRLGMGQVQASQCNVKRHEDGNSHQQPPGQGHIPIGRRQPRAKRLGRAA